jgi:hypothetical protein
VERVGRVESYKTSALLLSLFTLLPALLGRRVVEILAALVA